MKAHISLYLMWIPLLGIIPMIIWWGRISTWMNSLDDLRGWWVGTLLPLCHLLPVVIITANSGT
jgi:hypothetical protein